MTDQWADFVQPQESGDPWADFVQQAPDQGGGGVMGALKGASRALEANLPFVDRAVAAAKGGDYAANLAAEQAKNQQFAQANPWTNAVGGIAASAPLATVGGPSFGLGLAGRMTSAAVPWAVAGGIQGASSSPDLTDWSQRGVPWEALKGAAAQGTIGAAVPAVAAGIGRAVSPLATALGRGPGPAEFMARPGVPLGPAGAKLASDVSGAYKNVENLGAAYSPESIQALAGKISAAASDKYMNPKATPMAASIVDQLQSVADEGRAVPLPELDKIRQLAGTRAGGSPVAEERMFGNMIRGNIDDFIKNAGPEAMAGKPAAAAPNFNPPPGPDANYIPPGAPAPAAAAGARPVSPGGPAPPSLVTFLSRMGVKDEGGDLASMGFTKYPGLVRPLSGVPMDEARRAAAEAGYLDSDTTVDDLLDKISKHPTYARGADEDLAQRRSEYQDAMAQFRQAQDEAAPSQVPGGAAAVPPASVAPAQVPTAPSAAEASGAIQTARDLAMRQYKAKALAEALDKAGIRADVSGSGGNIENTTRQRLAAILGKEPWSADEAAQLNKMVHGTVATDTLRELGKLSPFGHAVPLYADIVGAGLGHAALPGAASAIGAGAQLGGALARRAAQRQLLATILAGGKAPAAAALGPGPTRAALAAALAARPQLQRRESTSQQ